MTRYHTHNRRKFDLRVHLIFVTKYRKRILTGEIASMLKKIIYELCGQNGWDVIACETDCDHVHLLVSYDMTDSVADIVKTLKQQTTYKLWVIFKDQLSCCYWKKKVLWSDGYFACSLGDASAKTVRRYIENQG